MQNNSELVCICSTNFRFVNRLIKKFLEKNIRLRLRSVSNSNSFLCCEFSLASCGHKKIPPLGRDVLWRTRRGWLRRPSRCLRHSADASAQSRTLTLFCVVSSHWPRVAIKKSLHLGGMFYGALGGVRTHNLLIRSQMLYPIELRVH